MYDVQYVRDTWAVAAHSGYLRETLDMLADTDCNMERRPHTLSMNII